MPSRLHPRVREHATHIAKTAPFEAAAFRRKTMKNLNLRPVIAVLLFLPLMLPGYARFSAAAEHPGKSTVEHPGHAVTADTVKKAIKDHVKAESSKHKGFLVVKDTVAGKEWQLKLDKIHDPVRMFEKDGKTIYFACSDFKAADGKDVLDIDFWMVPKGSKLEIIDTRIHKVNGAARYTYEGTNVMPIK